MNADHEFVRRAGRTRWCGIPSIHSMLCLLLGEGFMVELMAFTGARRRH